MLMLLLVLGAALFAFFVFKKTNKAAVAMAAGILALLVGKWVLFGFETFQSEWACASPPDALSNDKRLPWGIPGGFPKDATPFFYPQEQKTWAQQPKQGDNTLTNMYRQLYNLDNIQRTEIFKFGDALAGGGYGIPAEPYVGEAYDRAMMGLNERIRKKIAARRIPVDELYDIPTRPLMGNYDNCEQGNCQWNADADGRILGIPSQVGSQAAYF